ncbi:RDD family protein [Pseudomonas putida]|jgi:uncharacterized RDD family membrane protein YckC|uniref:RDD family protein n=1 Tax=Pseudomonas putida TaxID=303 RepID=UPI003D994062
MEVSRTSLAVRRAGAFTIDKVIVVLLCVVMMKSNFAFDGLVYLLVFLLYFPFCEYLMSGRTPGKYLFGIIAINGVGGPPTLLQVIIRNVTRYIEASLSLLVLFVFVNSRNCQRVGDIFARTYVIVVKDLEQVRLSINLKAAIEGPAEE